MKILYLSCHSILEHDEVSLFTELGHQVFSFGAYQDPSKPQDNMRPPIGGYMDENLQKLASQCTKEDLSQELINWADVVMVIHRTDWIISNWQKLKKKIVVWRTIGQSTPGIEGAMFLPRREGVKIVRYSPMERGIKYFAGEDAMIRFYKDENEFQGWNGRIAKVLTIAQSMKQRSSFCGYGFYEDATQGLPRAMFGTPSRNPDQTIMEDPLWCGQLPFDELKAAYRDYRIYFYTGTYPASYTLNFIEAMMTGIPVVAIGSKMANLNLYRGMNTYEVSQIIRHKENGFCSDDLMELKGNLEYILMHPDEGKRISQAGRETAIELFGKEKIKEEWDQFFKFL